jgi:ATP synthase protein I
MSDDKPAREPIGEDARIDALEKRLAAAREREDQRNQPQVQGADASTRAGNQVLAHLIGGPLGGAVVGYAIDRLAGTAPWGLLVMLGLGFIVAFRNIIRISNRPPGNHDD